MDLMMEDQDSEGGDGRRPSTASIDSLLEPRSPHIDPVCENKNVFSSSNKNYVKSPR